MVIQNINTGSLQVVIIIIIIRLIFDKVFQTYFNIIILQQILKRRWRVSQVMRYDRDDAEVFLGGMHRVRFRQ